MESKPSEPKTRRRRRWPLSRLIDGKVETVATECGPVVVSARNEDGQLLVVVDVPAEFTAPKSLPEKD